MDLTIMGPRLSLRGGSASLKRREARKRRFNLCREPIARNENGLEASKGKTGEESTAKRSHESTLNALHDHDVQAAAEEVNLSSHCTAAPEDVERQSTGLRKDTSQRFIVFVGNLPYSATEESIRRHFANLMPLSVRHRCEKDSGKSKGFAFLEFHNFDRMKTCLKTLHHSSFEDGISPARSINVELTAGGGGSKSKDRRLKLKAKNEKLKQERARRRLEQTKIKKGRTQMQKEISKQADNGDVHPSRRSRVAAPQ
ncbi:MAG: hypothetical protein Q9212_003400 [Teloschistes hypoglaucus]